MVADRSAGRRTGHFGRHRGDRTGRRARRCVGSARSVIAQTAQALKLLREAGNRCETHDEDAMLWSSLSAAPLQSAHDLGWRVSLRPGDLTSFINDVMVLETDNASQTDLR